MALNLYRRHGAKCPGGRALHEMTYEADEFRRGWRKCACPIYASGTVGGKFKRKNMEQSAWLDAKTVVATWQLSGGWPEDGRRLITVGAPPPEILEAPAEAGSTAIAIAEAVKSYMAVRKGAGITEATLRKPRTFTKQLAAFGSANGYSLLRQFSATDIDLFYANWKLGPRTKGHALGMLRGFFRFCVNREWIAKSPVTSDLKPPIGASRVANKIPFADEELQRIILACERIEPTPWSNGRH